MRNQKKTENIKQMFFIEPRILDQAIYILYCIFVGGISLDNLYNNSTGTLSLLFI